jgi:hypothetical protein
VFSKEGRKVCTAAKETYPQRGLYDDHQLWAPREWYAVASP